MGRLSEAINGRRGRPTYLSGSRSSGASSVSGGGSYVEVVNFDEYSDMLGQLMTSDYRLAANIRKLLRKLLREARGRLSKDVKAYLKSDPRKAARAVRNTVYKSVFGGNLNILYKYKASAPTSYKKPRTLRPGQVGGNRRPIGKGTSTARIEQYGGSDRGFILRVLNAGTEDRETRYGKRGALRQTNWFSHTAPWEMQRAAQEFADAITTYIKEETNG